MIDLSLVADPPTALSDAVWIDSTRRDRELVLGDLLRLRSAMTQRVNLLPSA
jgi:hypothetical protein